MYTVVVDVTCRCSGKEDAGIQEGGRTAAATNEENGNRKWHGLDDVSKVVREVGVHITHLFAKSLHV